MSSSKIISLNILRNPATPSPTPLRLLQSLAPLFTHNTHLHTGLSLTTTVAIINYTIPMRTCTLKSHYISSIPSPAVAVTLVWSFLVCNWYDNFFHVLIEMKYQLCYWNFLLWSQKYLKQISVLLQFLKWWHFKCS